MMENLHQQVQLLASWLCSNEAKKKKMQEDALTEATQWQNNAGAHYFIHRTESRYDL